MKMVFVIMICFALGGMPSETRSEEWTQFRGCDFMRTSEKSIAPEWNSEGIAWKTPLPGRGASSPVVFNDHVYLTAFTGYAIDQREPGDPSKLVRHLLCFDVNTGEQLWQESVPDDSEKDPFSTWGTAKLDTHPVLRRLTSRVSMSCLARLVFSRSAMTAGNDGARSVAMTPTSTPPAPRRSCTKTL